MKYTLIASLLTCAVYAAPFAQVQGGNQPNGQVTQGTPQQVQQGGQNTGGAGPTKGQQTGGAGVTGGQTPTADDLATAVSNWQADTSMVSNFLNTGKSITNNVQFKQAATVAFNAEVDELNHKAIIDAANGNQPNVIAANSTLATGGSFQDVVDKLQQMSVQGQAAIANIDLINQNRCVNVLPNIDAYMASTGSSSQAIRPTVCDQTGVAGGVQGTGPTQPNAPAGSPAAAFAAAQALAQGTGNGLVQNGATGGATTPAGTGAQTGTGVQQGQGGQQQGGQQVQQGGQQVQQGGQQVQQGGQQQQGGQIPQGNAPTAGQTQGQRPAGGQQAGAVPQTQNPNTGNVPQQAGGANAQQAASPATGGNARAPAGVAKL